MNIQSINFTPYNNTNYRYNTNVSGRFHTSPLKALDRDTVSFSGGEKVLTKRTKDISIKLARSVNEEVRNDGKQFLLTLRKCLKGVVESDANPNNPIMAGNAGIKGRVKTPDSIIEKALSRDLRTKNELKNMGDTIGYRITLRSGTHEDMDKVFKELEKMVKNGQMKIREIENYRLEDQFSYVSDRTLKRVEKTCHEFGTYPKIKTQAIPTGYTAVHVGVELPHGGQIAEIQIMGRDVERVKDLEDFYYKRRCQKHLAPKYAEIEKLIDKEMAKFDALQKQTLDRYIKDSYLHAREIAPRPSKKKDSLKDFLPIPYFMPEKLGFANLQTMKDACDNAEKLAKLAELTPTK